MSLIKRFFENNPQENPQPQVPVYKFFEPDRKENQASRPLVIFGAAALAALAILTMSGFAHARPPKKPLPPPPWPLPEDIPEPPPPSVTRPPGVGPGQRPPGSREQPTPPAWADPAPYGYNAQPGDPYVTRDGLWIAPDCSRWKMGQDFLAEIVAPLAQSYVDVGIGAFIDPQGNPQKQFLRFAGGFILARAIIGDYIRAFLPVGQPVHCVDFFPWPDTHLGPHIRGIPELPPDWTWGMPVPSLDEQCQALFPDSVFVAGTGGVCHRRQSFVLWQSQMESFEELYPALYNTEVPWGLTRMIWEIWFYLSYNQDWTQVGDLQITLTELRMSGP